MKATIKFEKYTTKVSLPYLNGRVWFKATHDFDSCINNGMDFGYKWKFIGSNNRASEKKAIRMFESFLKGRRFNNHLKRAMNGAQRTKVMQ